MNKEIYFCADMESYIQFSKEKNVRRSKSYLTTERYIRQGKEKILTTSLAHLSFNLIDEGYDIYICQGGRKVKIEIGMEIKYTSGESVLHVLNVKKYHDPLRLYQYHYFYELLK